MKRQIEVGQKVFLKPINNNAFSKCVRDNIVNFIKERKIVKIGRKYFYVDNGYDWGDPLKFNIESLEEFTGHIPDWQLYFSKQDILDEIESEKLIKKIENKINRQNRKNITLSQLKKIEKIIDNNDKRNEVVFTNFNDWEEYYMPTWALKRKYEEAVESNDVGKFLANLNNEDFRKLFEFLKSLER